jgi:glycerol uptake facilitator-like aquaporin
MPPRPGCERSSSCSIPSAWPHFNRAISLIDAALGGLTRREAAAYIPAQVAGCIGGAVLANVMFDLAPVSISTTHRATKAHGVSAPMACSRYRGHGAHRSSGCVGSALAGAA